jgi:signal transduction histidine kinase
MIKNEQNNSKGLLDNEIKILRQSELFIESSFSNNKDVFEKYIKLTENYRHLIDKFNLYILNSKQSENIIDNQIQIQEIDFNKIISDTVELLINNARKKNLIIETKLSGEIFVKYEEKMLRTICRHLISNAIKYSYTGGLIEISSFLKKDFIEFVVKDKGMGISKENLKKIFSVDSGLKTLGTGGEKGTGLGLIICKNYIEKSNGTLTVKSETGKGCRFEVMLPK